ncbi:Erv1/Alr family protein [Actinidia rufa]|uniref:Erv1/Alr family protein n=1 Tax=Actinidia rufa TaxID=165716 RepID=A0A7J0EU68_9ERIC|nr:Erv1/Alr family protein [Actinidia rufa]
MSENPLEAIFKTFDKISQSVRTQLSKFAGFSNHSSPANGRPPFSLASSFKANPLNASNDSSLLRPKLIPSEDKSTTPVTKEELGRSTWIFLHTLAAQMEILSRMYPCKDCADHFKEILSLGKVAFSCERVDARWGKLECEQRACDLQGSVTNFGDDMQ